MSDMWLANEDTHNMMRDVIGQNHPDLAILLGVKRELDEIQIVFREKAGKSGGRVVLGVAKKVPAIVNALAVTNYKFVLELAADQWETELDSKQRRALLDHLLCSCRTEEDPESGEMKCSLVKPDLSVFKENIERYGVWFPKDEGSESEDEVIEKALGIDE
jgi:hypothetical protein